MTSAIFFCWASGCTSIVTGKIFCPQSKLWSIANLILVCDPLSNSPFSWVFHNSTPKIFSIVLGEGGGEGGCREPRNESSSQLYQLLYVSLRNLKRNNKEENLKGIFRKSIPTKQLYTQCLFSFFFLFFFFSLFKVSSLGTQKTLLHAVMQEIPFTAYFYSGE